MTVPKQRYDLGTRLKGGVFAVVGLGLAIGVVAWTVSTAQFIKTAGHAPGIVSKLNAGGSHPEIVFTAASGQVVSYPQGGMIGGYKTGQHVSVLYNPHNPRLDPCLDTWAALWLDKLMLLGMGLVFLCIGGWQIFGFEEKEEMEEKS